MNQKRIEWRSLIVSAIVNFIMAVAGIVVFAITRMQALFLDGFFSFLAFLSNIMAIIFSKVSKKKNKAYPTGMYFLEPLYGLVKAILIFVLLTSSMVEVSFTAYNYFANGVGEAINITPILPYTIAMVIMSFGLSYLTKGRTKKLTTLPQC